MRILFVAPVAVEGGVAEVLAGLFRRSGEGLYEPHVIFLRDGPVTRRFAALGASVLSAGRLRSPSGLVRATVQLHNAMRRIRPDVVVALEPRAHLYSVVPAALQRIPALWMQHAIPGNLDRFVGRLPTAGGVMNSEFIRDLSRPYSHAPLYLVRPGVDVESFASGGDAGIRRRHGIADEASLIGIVGRLQSWKGQDLFLRAAALVAARDDTHFVVVGGAEMGWEDQDYPQTLVDLANELGIGERVTFTGQSSEIGAWMAAIDIVVHASSNEPYGMVICEAMAAGRPLVTVDEGGPLELVTDGRTGIVTQRDPAALAGAITRVLDDPALRDRLVVNGREHAHATMTDTAMARTFGQVLRAAAGEPSPPAGGRRPRVLFVAPVAVAGGANEVLLALAAARDASFEPFVAVLHPGPLVRRLSAAGVDHVLMDAGQFRSPLGLARTLLQLQRLVRSWRPDLVFSTEALGHLYAALPAARNGIPAVWRQPARPSVRHTIDRLATRLPARAVVVASEFIAGEQAKVGGRRVEVIKPGIDVARLRDADGAGLRRSRGIAADAVLIVMIGRLQPWKGQHLFLTAAATLAAAHPEARFAVVGGAEMGWETGDYPGQLRALTAKLGLKERVIFAGQSARVQDWYAAADIIVHASDHEPFGLVLCEAMLMGCAVISVDEGGPREIVEDGRTGLLVKRTAEDLARAMEALIADKPLRVRLGTDAREAARRDFTSARMIEQFEAFFARHARC